MARRANLFRPNSRTIRNGQVTRAIVTAIAERNDALLLTQLARGPYAGFWLLPSASVDAGAVTAAVTAMMLERTGYPVQEQCLISVIEETRTDALNLRFVFAVTVGEKETSVSNGEIVQARWFPKRAIDTLFEEKEIVPNLGVMSLIRAWQHALELKPLETLSEAALCPCGSGDRYRVCCGWEQL